MLWPFTASTTSPARRPDLAAGLPSATATTVSCPPPERCNQAPAHAVERDMPEHVCPSELAAVAEFLSCPSHATAGIATANASAATTGIRFLRFIFPP